MEQADASTSQTVVVLGAVSTVARAVAAEFAKEGYALVLGDPDADENGIVAQDLRTRYGVEVHPLPFDALAFDTHADFFEDCCEACGMPEGVVVCFGFMADQETVQKDFAQAAQTIDLNFKGAVSVLDVFANAFEARGNGFICALSSVAGDRGRKANYTYGAAKAGLT
ncbi:MAG TPA: SDR family NAD(P)-dependent oxidoreductase, partial [Candidatus Hydrogenedentes bacterium]|nr:SDR family NAD(P)-dependent oxidoreductase [Candidatus Hydrogenedentota bacterium]